MRKLRQRAAQAALPGRPGWGAGVAWAALWTPGPSQQQGALWPCTAGQLSRPAASEVTSQPVLAGASLAVPSRAQSSTAAASGVSPWASLALGPLRLEFRA